MKKQELTRRIYKYNVPLKTLKYSYLYLLAIEKKDVKGNIMERYVKFGKTIDAKKRYKAFEKDYAGYEIGYIWISFDRGFRWLNIETTYIENKLKKKLDYAFEKYSDRILKRFMDIQKCILQIVMMTMNLKCILKANLPKY